MLFHVHLCLVITARNGRRNDDDQPDRSRHCRTDGTALTSLLCDDRYRPVGEAGAIGYLQLSSKSELRFGTYGFVSDYGCPHPGMPLCHKQSRRSRDAPMWSWPNIALGTQRTFTSIPRYASASTSAPTAINAPPASFIGVRLSPRNNHAQTMTMTTLSLSMGATLDAGPSCSARK